MYFAMSENDQLNNTQRMQQNNYQQYQQQWGGGSRIQENILYKEKLQDIILSIDEVENELLVTKQSLSSEIEEMKHIIRIEGKEMAELQSQYENEKTQYDQFRRDFDQKTQDVQQAHIRLNEARSQGQIILAEINQYKRKIASNANLHDLCLKKDKHIALLDRRLQDMEAYLRDLKKNIQFI